MPPKNPLAPTTYPPWSLAPHEAVRLDRPLFGWRFDLLVPHRTGGLCIPWAVGPLWSDPATCMPERCTLRFPPHPDQAAPAPNCTCGYRIVSSRRAVASYLAEADDRAEAGRAGFAPCDGVAISAIEATGSAAGPVLDEYPGTTLRASRIRVVGPVIAAVWSVRNGGAHGLRLRYPDTTIEVVGGRLDDLLAAAWQR